MGLPQSKPRLVAAQTSPNAARSLSNELWGIDWKHLFPLSLPGGASVEMSSYEEAGGFLQKHHAEIFRLPLEAGPVAEQAARARYYKLAGDFFVFRFEGAIVGVFIGSPHDWSTYYIRYVAMLPTYQRRGWLKEMLVIFLDHLREHSVSSVEYDFSPVNRASMHSLKRWVS